MNVFAHNSSVSPTTSKHQNCCTQTQTKQITGGFIFLLLLLDLNMMKRMMPWWKKLWDLHFFYFSFLFLRGNNKGWLFFNLSGLRSKITVSVNRNFLVWLMHVDLAFFILIFAFKAKKKRQTIQCFIKWQTNKCLLN